MTLTHVLHVPNTAPPALETASEVTRRRALERLYERKAAVDQLIESLEGYQRCRTMGNARALAFTAISKCS